MTNKLYMLVTTAGNISWMKSGGAHVSTSRERHVPRSGSSLTVHRIFWVDITWSTVSPVVIIVYHVTIVAIGHWLLKKCWPSVIVFYALQGAPLYETMQTRLLRLPTQLLPYPSIQSIQFLSKRYKCNY